MHEEFKKLMKNYEVNYYYKNGEEEHIGYKIDINYYIYLDILCSSEGFNIDVIIKNRSWSYVSEFNVNYDLDLVLSIIEIMKELGDNKDKLMNILFPQNSEVRVIAIDDFLVIKNNRLRDFLLGENDVK